MVPLDGHPFIRAFFMIDPTKLGQRNHPLFSDMWWLDQLAVKLPILLRALRPHKLR